MVQVVRTRVLLPSVIHVAAVIIEYLDPLHVRVMLNEEFVEGARLDPEVAVADKVHVPVKRPVPVDIDLPDKSLSYVRVLVLVDDSVGENASRSHIHTGVTRGVPFLDGHDGFRMRA